MFKDSFASLRNNVEPQILYPAIYTDQFVDRHQPKQDQILSLQKLLKQPESFVREHTKIVTSLNRYERKKNIGLALHSFAKYLKN